MNNTKEWRKELLSGLEQLRPKLEQHLSKMTFLRGFYTSTLEFNSKPGILNRFLNDFKNFLAIAF